ncbi:DUF2213 domain-containing protein [Fulvimarina sp. 2208YS6-2-32]|uniref:DUF2213 domain-containing protein n=1 Tax=Fulvimarina uroteuthidis TaxID=3098149 RepID=A0ABU5HZ78_9HYPH|nr:DUF2213 domain-containing protein [Fulvimarina sp. 2208YS6-2-32]MDY8108266.1 DUF2213 domain-containing protein [Fulvimarina sp. 2208YS6-2-32]
MNFTDASPLTGARETADGYLIADAFALRTGVQTYLGSEVGRSDLATVNVYRPESEVFSADSLRSLSHAPVTDDHPSVAVDSANWASLGKGEVSDEVLRDGGRLRIPLIVKDAATVAKVKAGKRQLSAGYVCDLEWKDGVAEDGASYQAVQRNIRFNHLAIVDRARAGDEFRIGDGANTEAAASSWGVAPIQTNDRKEAIMADNLTTVVLGDKAVQVTDKDAPIIEQFKTQFAADKAALVSDHDKALATKDAELATKDAKIAELEGKVLSDADLDKRVAARAELVGKAKTLAKDADFSGKTDAEIRRAAVTAVRGADAMAGKSDAYVDAAFDLAVEAAGKPKDSFADAIAGGPVVQIADAFAAREKAFQELCAHDTGAHVKKGA